MMSTLRKNLLKIITCNSDSLKGIASDLGIDYRLFYRGANLEGIDLRGQDLDGIDLGGSRLSGAKFDNNIEIRVEAETFSGREVRFAHSLQQDARSEIRVSVYVPHHVDQLVFKQTNAQKNRGLGRLYASAIRVGIKRLYTGPLRELQALHPVMQSIRGWRGKSSKRSVMLDRKTWEEARKLSLKISCSYQDTYLLCAIGGIVDTYNIQIEKIVPEDDIQMNLKLVFPDQSPSS
jgi:hypothetical protein